MTSCELKVTTGRRSSSAAFPAICAHHTLAWMLACVSEQTTVCAPRLWSRDPRFLHHRSTPCKHGMISMCSTQRALYTAICTSGQQQVHAYLMLAVTPGRLLLDLRCGASSVAVRHCRASFHQPYRGCSARSRQHRCGTTSAVASMADGGTAAPVSVPTTICFATGNANKLKEVIRAIAYAWSGVAWTGVRIKPAQIPVLSTELGLPGQVTAILAAGHHLPFDVKGVNVDLPELQVRSDVVCINADHPVH